MTYKNKYYDPVKAHAYYEAHKHLKGRHSTKGMSQSQKEMAAYAKAQLNAQKQKDIKKATAKSQSRAAEKRKQFADSCKAKVANLKAMLKNMPEAERKNAKAMIEKRIRSLRSDISKRKKAVTASYSSALKGEKDKIRSDYDNRYAMALSQIRGK